MVSRSDPSSFGSGTASSSSSSASSSAAAKTGFRTPTSILPQVSGDWTDISADLYFELTQAFKLIDRDNDGLVSRNELEALLARLGAEPPSGEEMAVILGEVDHISVEALASRLGTACEPAGDDELRDAFVFFDSDRDGKITADELLNVYKAFGDDKCTLEDCRRMIAVVDKNGDGFVCFEDFCRMMELRR
ncbi:Calmodulin-like family protein [Populus alba x Populus x berolinensis]|uniref:Calmodulin-like family protein n=1 Tax=Populus alba x Populus x berolinensis TaxID=444605 RepID=A0AAD6QKW1_9ROSI|nr:Calmodulin-like family protein [Populus alba x Populus x berolinensis]